MSTPGAIESHNPATLEPIGTVPETGTDAVGTVVAEVAAVTPLWAQLRVADRARYLDRAAQGIIDDFDEHCELLVRESGRPRGEVAAFELLAAIDTLQWLATNARRLLSARAITLPRAIHPLKRASAGHAPLGVIAVIGAGSAPFATPITHAAAALLGGNGVVLKPAPRASQAAEAIGRVLARAGLPEGLVRVIHGHAALGTALAGDRGVAHVLFSGGRPAGGAVAAECAGRGVSATLDIAAGEAMVVLADANLDAAATGALWAACAGAGQLRGKVARIYVERAAHEALTERLVHVAGTLTLGDPLEHTTQIGPLASAGRQKRMTDAIASSLALGARQLCGRPQEIAGLAGAFYSPVVLSGSVDQLAALRDYVPGPLLGVTAVGDPVAAVALEAGAELARGASVWSADRRHAARIARELRPGVVWCNDHLVGPVLPRDGAAALAACVSGKLITWDPLAARPPWRQPYDEVGLRGLRALAALHGTRPGDRERALRDGAAPLARVAGRALRSRG
ncbi:MAG: aldehyde dehydrogenase family protein [Solirubrobacteraceae bacterium]